MNVDEAGSQQGRVLLDRRPDGTLVVRVAGPWHIGKDIPSAALLTRELETHSGAPFKATFYGMLIAIAACLRGFHCGNRSSALGDAATQAVVMSIVMVVAACGLFAVVFNFLGIPILSYQLGQGWYLKSSDATWTSICVTGPQRTIPLSAGFGKV